MTQRQYPNTNPRQLKPSEPLQRTHWLRFGSGELYIAIAVVLVMAALMLPILRSYLSQAQLRVMQANAHNLYLAVTATLLLDRPGEEQLALLEERYADFEPVETLLAQQTPIEQLIVGRLDNSAYLYHELAERPTDSLERAPPLEGYVKLVRQGQQFHVLLSGYPDGHDAVRYPIEF